MTLKTAGTRIAWLAGLFLVCTSGLFAQCPNATINSAFSLALSRAPFKTQAEANAKGFTTMYLPSGECDAGRYAGGAFSSSADLIPLVKASLVCQDPWIAQGYYLLRMQLNGHDPTVMENGRPGSTQGLCNIKSYVSPQGVQDGWSTFSGLQDAIRRHSGLLPWPNAAPTPQSGTGATITSASLVKGQAGRIAWTYSGTSTCPQGVIVQLNGNNYSAAVPLNAGSVNIDPRFTNFAYSSNTQVALTVADACTARAISPAFNATVVVQQAPPPAPVPAPKPTPPPTPAPPPSVTISSFHLISALGSRCLAVRGANTNPGTKFIIWDCLDSYEQAFQFMDDGRIRAFGGASNICLQEEKDLLGIYHPVTRPCNSQNAEQLFKFQNGRLTGNTGLCLDMWGGWATNFAGGQTDAQMATCNGGGNQSFVAGITLPRGNSINPIATGVQTPIAAHGIGADIVSHNGSAVVAAGAGNVVAAGAGNVVAAGAGNVVAAGAGNVVAAGAGNVIIPWSSGVVVSTRPY